MTDWEKEKESIRRICQDLVIEVLWNPNVLNGHSETEHHDIKVWKANGVVKMEIRRKEG